MGKDETLGREGGKRRQEGPKLSSAELYQTKLTTEQDFSTLALLTIWGHIVLCGGGLPCALHDI